RLSETDQRRRREHQQDPLKIGLPGLRAARGRRRGRWRAAGRGIRRLRRTSLEILLHPPAPIGDFERFLFPFRHPLLRRSTARSVLGRRLAWASRDLQGPCPLVYNILARPSGSLMANSAGDRFDSLLEVMSRLRGEGGCPWDREQTRETLKPYLI